MTKALEIAKNKAICDILSAVSDDTDLTTLKAKITAICRKYFPDADLTMLNIFNDFGYFAQHYFSYLQFVSAEVNRYHREQKTPNPNSQDCRRPAGGKPRKPGGSVEVFCATIEVRKQPGN